MMQEQLLASQAGPGHPVDSFALSWLQSEPMPRMMVDRFGRVMWRNSAAERLLLDCPDLDARDGQLTAEDRASNAQLAAMLANAGDQVKTFSLPCEDGDGHLLFAVRRLSGHEADPVVAITVYRTGSKSAVRYASFRAAFGLTESEHHVALLLVEGRKAEEIAGVTGTSIGTVRSHIRSIYAKTDVSSREGLFRRLSPFRLF